VERNPARPAEGGTGCGVNGKTKENMEKKLITAIALSILIIVAFQYFLVKPVPPAPVTAPKGTVPQKGVEILPVAESQNLPAEKETEAITDKYVITFSNIGGSIKDIKLKDYKTLNSKEPLDLVRIANPKEHLFNMSDLLSGQTFDLVDYELKTEGLTITYALTTKDYAIKKKYILHKYLYNIELEILVKNLSASPKEFAYSIIGGADLTEKNAQDKRLIEVRSKVDGKTVGFKRPRRGERIINLGMVGWSALKNKYFSLILKPFAQTRGEFCYEDPEGNLITGVDSEKTTIQPGDFIEHKYSLYVGPSDIATLKEFGYGVEESVNYGMFGGISKGIIVVLRLCYSVVRNWGLSIIILSVLLNVILFPLTMNSFKSMQKMQELHPQMEKLKTQFKDQPQKLNKEIMELYKKYNINPFSGCLPILLQMPIFIALYQALMKSIELRGASFLWIRDLSSPEAIPLPVSFPIIGDSINILPLIMVAAMVIQQKISTASAGSAITEEQKQQQKMMLIIMPIMFGFIFYNMPSGLVLYWSVNTLLTIIEQAAILRKAQ
jgi:YidC/Oxa1 family membrane protein insertase